MKQFLLIAGALAFCWVGHAATIEDERIAACEKWVREQPESVEARVNLAAAYHWKKDFVRAEREYRAAIALDGRTVWFLIPLLDEQEKWDEIIALGSSGNLPDLSMSVLGSLLSAHHARGEKAKVDLLLAEIERRSPPVPLEQDLRNYILAYVHLWKDENQPALDRLKAIKTPDVLHYARTSPKFKKLHEDPEFLRLTARSQ